MEKFETHFEEQLLPQMAVMARSIEALVKDSTASKTRWEWWWDIASRVTATLYRSAVLVMFAALFTKNTELGKAVAPWIGKWFFP